jgi:wyosine [tRNA(Phe)-imidazoG37] synthetase (radical SAM superfamily)
MIVFGPVPSRRLGRSLGINSIPSKVCSYSCVYCQLGRTSRLQLERSLFFPSEEIAAEVTEKIRRLREMDESVDYLSFVANGEPTLDANLGRTIDLLKPLGIKIAVISNASLMWREDVRQDLAKADWVSLKIDSVIEDVWRRVDRPHGRLDLSVVLDGMVRFAAMFRGELVTDTMLLRNENDSVTDMELLGRFLVELQPARAYLSLPTRPPAERRVEMPDQDSVNRAYQVLHGSGIDVELLAEFEGTAFSGSGNVADDLLAITAVHPMREDAVHVLLAKAGSDWSRVAELVAAGYLAEAEYQGEKYYLKISRKLQQNREEEDDVDDSEAVG